MSREIKFRAWRGSEMIYQSESGYHAVAHFFNRVHGQHEVMQFTGLKDKNGREVYEGDIITIMQCECVGHSADGSEEEWIACEGPVLFEDAMFVFEGHSAGSLPLCAYKDYLEVIGNKFENPELPTP